MKTRVYIQTEHFPQVQLIEVESDATIEDVKRAAIALLPAGTDPAELTLSIEDHEESHHHETPVRDVCKDHGVRVHLHRCKHVGVAVHFSGKTVTHEFRPATTVGAVRDWAGRQLGMQPGDIAEHVLQISGTNDQPEMDVHVGALTKRPACVVAFDMVPAHRING